MNLGASGQAIWAVFKGETLGAGDKALILELARCADMCDKLDGLAAGREDRWALLAFDDMGEIHLQIDKVLELRLKHQLALKTLYAEVRAAKIGVKEGGGEVEQEDMLARARRMKEERERQSG